MLSPNKQASQQGALLFLLLVVFLYGSLQSQEFTTSKGMKIKIVQDNTFGFIHARVAIYYNTQLQNPALPALTATNIFSKEYNPSGSPVLNTLRNLGNDFEIQNRPDSLLIRINFLPDKIKTFTEFLKNLYRYRPFFQSSSRQSYNYNNLEQATQKTLVESKRNYWQDFKRKKHWKRKVAMQIAYSRLFPNQMLGRILVTPDTLNRATLAGIRTFYRRNYTPQNTQIFLKGKLHPGIVSGQFEWVFKSFKKPEIPVAQPEIPVPSNKREIIILHIDSVDSPLIFWVNTIPPVSSKHHLEAMLLNDYIFSYPLGVLPRHASRFHRIRFSVISQEIAHHHGISIICNTIGVKFNEVEKVILLADGLQRRLQSKGITRKEILDISSYFLGKYKVSTEDFDSEITTPFDTYRFQSVLSSPKQLPSLLQQVSTTSIKQAMESPRQSIIVIVGNSKLIMDHINILKQPIIYQIF